MNVVPAGVLTCCAYINTNLTSTFQC